MRGLGSCQPPETNLFYHTFFMQTTTNLDRAHGNPPGCRRHGIDRSGRCCQVLAVFVLSFLFFCSQSAAAGRFQTGEADVLAGLVDHGGYLLVAEGRVLAAREPETLLVPASTLKFATALAALAILGPEYRFETRIVADQAGNLFIQGGGDPLLVSEEVAAIAAALRQRGLASVGSLFVDGSFFALDGPTSGSSATDNPYDAQNGALAVNFNTVHVEVGENGRVRSAEPQTPTVGLMAELADGMRPGVHRLNITRSGAQANDRTMLLYAGQLFRAFLEKEGITVTGSVEPRPVPAGLEPLYLHRSSRTVAELLEPLMLYSNNFIANQLFLACGAKLFGAPATWDKGRRAVSGFVADSYGLGEADIQMEEGSGLSRANRITPAALLRLLEAYEPYAATLPEEDGMLLKSGTLTGVYCYAGYFRRPAGLAKIVVLLNQKRNTRDQVVAALGKLVVAD